MRNLALLIPLLLAASAPAQDPAKLAGDYAGVLGPLHLKLHLKVGAGTFTGTLDSVDQGANGLALSNVKLDGGNLSFDVPSVNGSWKGSVNADASTLDGAWSQGNPQPLVFTREAAFVPAPKLSAVDGTWLGTLQAGGQSLRIQLHVKSDAAGREYCTLDSLDQGASGLECSNVTLDGSKFSFDVPAVHGNWSGSISADHNVLNGTWSQGKPLTLNFARQEKPIAMKGPHPPTFQPALAPVSLADLQQVLDRDLVNSLKEGALAHDTGVGAVVGVIQHGTRRLLTYGSSQADSVFEIGSVSKTFTGLILAQMVEQGKVKFDEPVRDLLPAKTVPKPQGAEITLLDLATQHSGLPRLPGNMHPADPQNPYADYKPADLYAYLSQHGVSKNEKTDFLYSNLGVGLLGQALANCAKQTYGELLREEVTGPLHLNDTTIALSASEQKRFMEGHTATYKSAHSWDLDALAGAGAIRSSAGDLLTYLEANLHPDRVKVTPAEKDSATLLHALEVSHELRADAMGGMKIALVWLYKPDQGTYWHNGASGGYSAYVSFSPKSDTAVAVLVNMSIGQQGSFADKLGEHVEERLAGLKAITVE